MGRNTAQPPLSTEEGRKGWCEGSDLSFCCACTMSDDKGLEGVSEQKSKGGKKERREGKRWYDSDTPGVGLLVSLLETQT